MSSTTNPPLELDENRRQSFAGLILMDRVISQDNAYHAALLEGEDELLDGVFKYLLGEDLVEIGAEDYYEATEKGKQAYQNMMHQQQSYLVHFDIFGRVDLADGSFADLDEDFLEDSRWSDLRVSVALYKGIDPYRMVFLAMLAEGQFFENPDWKFDLALGSSFFAELEEIVGSQTTMDDLAYVAEDGAAVSGASVIEDVILQGSGVNKQRMEREQERARQESLLEEEERRAGDDDDDEGDVQWVMMPYDPWGSMAMYAGSAMFVEALWLSAMW